MIAEDVLERGLQAAAQEYEVPAAAVPDLHDLLAPRAARERRRWHPTRRAWWAIAAAAAVGVIALPFAVGGGTSTPSADSAEKGAASVAGGGVAAPGAPSTGDTLAPVPAASPVRGAHLAPTVGSGSGGTVVPDRVDPTVPTLRSRIVKTGELDLQVARGEVSQVLDRIAALAAVRGGYVADSRTSEGGPAPSGQVTLRVPVDQFEATISRARTYGDKVLSLETSSQDVTSKYVDVKARIKALDATRKTFLQLLAKATTIGETLAVQQRVTDVQTQIEQLQGQLRVLQNRSAMSTLVVTVDQKVAPAPTQHHESGISRAFHRSVDRFVNGVEAIVGALGPLLLIAILTVAAWLAARFGYRRLRRRLV